ncbi:MAG: CBS domain-containing protein [Methanoculleaceae archaeon]
MENQRNINTKSDKLLRMPGKLDRGPVEFESHKKNGTGGVMRIATREVVSISPTTAIIKAAEMMQTHGFRRLLVTNPGTQKLEGLVTGGDIIDFMGGGTKYNLIRVKHGGNFLSAVNDRIREIMTHDVVAVQEKADLDGVVEIIINRKIGGIPIVSTDNVLRGLVTERDVMRAICREDLSITAEEIMSTSLRVIHPDSPIGEATREMVHHRFRRLPVVADDILCGIITTSDIIRYLGSGRAFEQLVTGDVAEVMSLPVRAIQSTSLHTITTDITVDRIARKMLDKDVGSLPVIEDGRLVGLVTEYDLVRAFGRG